MHRGTFWRDTFGSSIRHPAKEFSGLLSLCHSSLTSEPFNCSHLLKKETDEKSTQGEVSGNGLKHLHNFLSRPLVLW